MRITDRELYKAGINIIVLQIEDFTGITGVNVLIIDCEGCHTKFIKTYEQKLSKVSKIIFGELNFVT